MSIRLSVLKRSIRPRSAPLTRGCATCRILAAAACVSPREASAFCSWMRRSARTTGCSDSSTDKPRSRNTLPVDGVIFRLPFRRIVSSLLQQRTQSIARQRHVMRRRLPRLLLERVEHVHAFLERGDVHHAMREVRLNPNLPHTGPTPVSGFQSSGSSPCCTLRTWSPLRRRASAGNALMSRRALPSQMSDFSGRFTVHVFVYMSMCRRGDGVQGLSFAGTGAGLLSPEERAALKSAISSSATWLRAC